MEPRVIECRVTLKNADFIMQNHRVHDVSVMPGVTFLDIIYRILETQGLDCGRAELRDILFPEAIATREGLDREIRVVLAEDTDGVWRVEAKSRGVANGKPHSSWRENLQCKLIFSDEPALPEIDIEAMKSAAVRVREMDELYAEARAEGIRHGAPMMCRGRVYQGREALLVELPPPEASSAFDDRFYLHPAKLDASTIAAFAHAAIGSEQPFIPVFMERFRALARTEGVCYVHVPQPATSATTGDVVRVDYVLCDAQGRVVAVADKLTCKRIRFQGLITRLLEDSAAPPVAVPLERAREDEPPPEASKAVARRLCNLVGRYLGRPFSEVETDVGFYEMGLDSVAMLQISRELESVVGAPLYPTLLFEFADIDSLARHLAEKYDVGESADSSSEAAAPSSVPERAVAGEAACYRESWVPASGVAAGNPSGGIVLFGGPDDTREATAHALAARGRRVIAVMPGRRFQARGEDRFSLDIRDREQLGQLLNAAARTNASPRTFVHLPSPADDVFDPARIGESFFAYWATAAALIDGKPEQPCNLYAIGAGHVGNIQPQCAPLAAAAGTMAQETPVLRCRSIGIDRLPDSDTLCRLILAEEADESGETEVRYHADRRSVRRQVLYTPSALAASQHAADTRTAALKRGGVYLLAGGGGGIGNLLADHLVREFSARLVLVGRSPVSPALQARLDDWARAGGEVHYLRADVSQRDQVEAALARARELFGGLDGIFHLAGVNHDAVFFRKRHAEMQETLAGKLGGALNLDAASRNDRLDFFVLFSSLAATLGNRGQCDYAFANAALESFADWRARQAGRPGKTLAIGWPLWADGGMQATSDAVAGARDSSGLWPMPSPAALRMIEDGLAGPQNRFVVAYGDRNRFEPALAPPAPAVPEAPVSPESAARAETGDFAIVGLAGEYPQAADLNAFWRNLASGRDCITEVPGRWDHERWFDPERGRDGKTYSRWGGFLDGVEHFDPAFFNISRKEAEGMDPQERLFLKTAWKTLEDAGYTPKALAGESVGVFVGVMWSHYQLFNDHGAEAAPTALHASVANRVSYCLDFHGPSLAVDTACSSSLTALALAVDSLRRGDCSVALAGGVNVTIHPQKYLQLARGQFLSDDGRCRSFGDGGTGYVPGEGVGAVLIKPLARARADGDLIYGVIKGALLNHTGRTGGFTVPSPTSQAALIRTAIERAGIDPRSIGYIEAHGTGTALGDPIEIEGLREAFAGAGLEPGRCAIGSVKSNIGHLESAAGIAGLTKVLLQMKHRQLVPSLHAGTLNRHIAFESAPVRLQRELAPWRSSGGPLYAGISSFGAGGANAHVLLQSEERERSASDWRGPCLLVLSARDAATLRRYATSLESFLAQACDREAAHDQDGVRPFLVERIAELLAVPIEAVDSAESFDSLGIDTSSLAGLARQLDERFAGAAARIDISLDATVDLVAQACEGLAPLPGAAPLALDDVAYTLQVGRVALPERLAIVAHDLAQVRSSLQAFVQGAAPTPDCRWGNAAESGGAARSADACVALFRAGRLRELAADWVGGADVPWRSCYPREGETKAPRRVSLPTYPFREEAYWVGQWRASRAAQPVPAPAADQGGGMAREAGARAKDAHPPAAKDGGVDKAQPEIELRILDGVALVAMQDSANSNMFTDRLVARLEAAFTDIAARPEVKAVVVTGGDDVFSMGATPQALEQLASKQGRFTDVPFLYHGLLHCPVPVIAAMQGDASGGGLIFGLHADIVVMARESVYSANFVKYGFTPGIGATYVLEQRFGRALATEMFFTGRGLSGEELERRGGQVTFRPRAEVLATALDLARAIADKPVAAVRALKQELSGRVLEILPEIVAREADMHDRVLGDEARRLVGARFDKLARATNRAEGTNGSADGNGSASAFVVRPAPVRGDGAADTGGSAASTGRRQEVQAAVEDAVCANLYLDRHELDRRLSFSDMGVDSIGAVKIARDLGRRFDLDIDSVVIYDYPTVPQLTDHVVNVLGQAQAFHAEATGSPRPDAGRDKPAEKRAEAAVVLKPLMNGDVVDPPRNGSAMAMPPTSARPQPIVLKPAAEAPSTQAGRPQMPAQSARTGDIAVIGMSARFPDAPDLATLWANLAAGLDSVREVPPERWDVASIFDPDIHAPDKTTSKWAALLDEVDQFDAAFFNLSPFEAELMDPEQRLFLEEAWKGLEDAGYAVGSPQGTRCGVFVGCTQSDYITLLSAAGKADTGQAFLGNSASVLAARIAYFLNLNGPTLAVDTACSSSLVAVHLACESIRNNECEMALAGGVALMVTPQLQVRTSKMGILSPTGRCAPFDASADGIVLGEGVGAVVLKALGRAIEDGDHIHGIIRGSGINGDGKTNGITAPSALSQEELLARVHTRAGVSAGDIGYVETHGTGTALGDPIEFRALKNVFGRSAPRGGCGIGSIKSNLGHTTMAAGVAGLLKVLLAMRHGRLPPSLNFEKANPKIDLADSPFFVPTRPVDWQPGPTGARIAAVSSFGFSGTNCHVVVAEPPPRPQASPAEPGSVLVPVSAHSQAALTRRLTQLAACLTVDHDLRDVAFTLGAGRSHLPRRAALVVGSIEELRRKLQGLADGARPEGCVLHASPDAAADRLPADGADALVREVLSAPNPPAREQALLALAEAYGRGHNPDWQALYRDAPRRRISLPAYPFERARHWVEARPVASPAAARKSPPHALPDQARVEPEAVTTRTIRPDDRMVADHRVGGVRVLPAAAGLAMAAAAATARGMPLPLRMSQLQWLRPIEAEVPLGLRLALRERGGEARFEFAEDFDDEPGSPAMGGAIAPLDRSDEPARFDVAAATNRCPRRVSRNDFYAAFEAAGIDYGPAFRRVEEVAIGEEEAVGRLIAPPCTAPEEDVFTLHPVTLDAALQVCAALETRSASQAALPFSVDSFDIHRPLTGPGFSYVKREGDHRYTVVLMDLTGQVCVRCRGFTLRAPKTGGDRKTSGDDKANGDDMILVPAWREATVLPSRASVADESGRTLVVHTAATEPLARAIGARLPDGSGTALPLHEAPAVLERDDQAYDTIFVLADAPPCEDVDAGTLALFRLVKALIAGGRMRQRQRLKIAVSGTVALTDDEPVRPDSAGVLGLAQAVADEYPSCSVQCVDLGGDTSDPDKTAELLLSEMPDRRLVAIRGGRCLVRGFRPGHLPATTSPFKTLGSYLLLGGAGGIGMALSRELARAVQARLTWVGRRPPDAAIARQIDEIASLGGEAIYIQADAADEDALRTAVAEARRRFGRIDGAFHSALVLSDKTLANMGEDILRRALAPKCAGAANFARALEDEDLDFMVLFSSAASFLPSAGQANYAAASTFEDAFALSLRRRCRFPVSVINWGYWGSVGAVATESYRRRFAALGVGSIEPDEGFAALTRLLANKVPQALVIKAAPQRLQALGVDIGIGEPVGTGSEAGAASDGGGDLARSRAGFARLDMLARHLLFRSFRQHAILPEPGTRTTIAQLQERARLVPRHGSLFAALLAILERAGMLRLADGDEAVVEDVAAPDACEAADLVRQFPDLAPHVRLLETCVEALPEVLDGHRQPLDVLFPKGSTSLVEPVYKGQPGADYFHRLLAAQAVAAASAAAKEGRVPRLLEIGAGTGAATSFVLEACAVAGLRPEYHYTDISPSFLRHGERAFARASANIVFHALDIEREPDEQDFTAEGFDVVIAANVLHATSVIDRTMARIHRLLRPGGVALVNEITRSFDFLTLTFGLTAGWWAFDDADNRIAHAPLLDTRQWRAALGRAGFQGVQVVGIPGTPADDLEQGLFVAEKAAVVAEIDSGLERRTCGYLKRVFAEILKLRQPDLPERETFDTFGVDSLVGMNIVHRLEQDLGPLPSTLLFEHLTIEAMARHLAVQCRVRLTELLGAEGPARIVADVPSAPAEAAQEADAPSAASGGPAGAATDIAIVGVVGRYPGAADLDAFWANLAAGVDSVTEIPPERWDWREQFDPRRDRPHKSYSRWGGFLDGVDLFDPLFFNILPRDARKIDPQERLFLEACWNLLEEAGYLGEHTHEPRTGVFVGTMYGSYGQLGATRWAQGELAGPHSAYWSIANRVSYCFDFQGPSFAVDSACSSSLTAVHLACESIRRGECRMAIAGGVNLILHPAHFAALCSLNMLSDDGGCKVFDADANGIVPGEGVGAVLLKPLRRAVADGDAIWGVIKGSFVNAGGKTSGYSVPNPQAQAELVAEAWRRAGIDPRTVGYVEAHGTGTELGDPIEIKGLTKGFGAAGGDRHSCAVGSVKANIGHLEGAAGIAGLTKVLLQLKHGQLAPCIRVSALNPKIDFESSPFYPPLQLVPWPRPLVGIDGEERACPRRAGVSSFGAGGANVHIAIEEYRGAGRAAAADRPANPDEEQLFILSARTPQQLQAYAAKVAAFLSSPQADAASLAEIAYSSQIGRRAMTERLAVVARSKAVLAERLAGFGRAGQSTDVLTGSPATNAGNERPLFDEDDTEFIQSLVARRRLTKLGRAWLLGVRIDWRLLWPDPKPPRVPFPTYPFERKSYWFAAPEPGSDVVAPPPEYDAEHVLDEAAFYVTDHRIGGARWVPGAALLQLACAAAKVDAPCRLRTVRWPSPLNVDEQPARLRVRFARDGEVVRFRLATPDGAGASLASGVLVPGAAAAADRIDLDAVRARCPDARDVAAFYLSLRQSGLHYGPALQTVEQLHVGEGEVLARLALSPPAARGDEAFMALLDGAMQSIAGLFDGSTGYVPTGLSELAWYSALPPRCWVHAREAMPSASADGGRSFDIDIFDDDGRVLLSVERLQIVPRRAGPTVVDYRRPVWSRHPIAGEPRAVRTMLVLTEDEAFAQALMARHASDGTRVIVVSAGEAYDNLGGFRYRIALGAPDDHRQLADELDRSGMLPDAVVHLCPGQPLSADASVLSTQLDRGFRPLLWLTAAILERRAKSPLRVVFGYGDDAPEPQPHHAAVAAALKTLVQEHPRLSARHVALTGGEAASAELVAAWVSEELLHCADGASEVRYQGGERWTRGLEPFEPVGAASRDELRLQTDGAYLITGGAGALGLRFAGLLAERGPVRIILAGRSPLGDEQRARIERLLQSGATVEYVQADIERRSEVDRMIADVKARHGPIRGIIHAAGAHRDALATRKTAADVDIVLGPKVFGTVNLDAATAEEPLDFFVLFSSVVAESGNAGQADYAFANAFLNRFAELRDRWVRAGRRAGKTLSIGWPLWAEGGMTVDPATRQRLERTWGMVPMTTQAGLRAFQIGLRGSESCFTVVERVAKDPPPVSEATSTETAAPALSAADCLSEVETSLRSMAAAFLLIPEKEVDMQIDLLETGFDSVSLTELINQVNALYGIDLLPTELFECATLAAFARYLADRHPSAVAARHAMRPAPDNAVTPDAPAPASPAHVEGAGPATVAARPPPVGSRPQDVAIIGMACRFPQCDDLAAFWRHLIAGDDLITAVPEDRVDLRNHPATRDVRGGFLADVACFDARFFGISPQEAALMDPQQRLFLETVWTAIQDAGYQPAGLSGSATGLFVGVGTSDYGDLLRAHGIEVEAHTATGIAHSILANRISHRLDLRGSSEVIDTACSSSLVAVHRAVRAIRSGECDTALAGGVNVLLSPALYTAFFKSGMLSGDGRCRSFDAGADGYVRGEGAGAVLLKPLARAIRDGDPIHAVIKGSAVNHCGRTASLTAPSPEGQAQVLTEAWLDAGIAPRTLGYIEAHGTGTKLGDPIELQGMKKALAELCRRRGEPVPAESRIAVGSVKSNIGHLEAASGIAGLVKLVLSMHHGELPPSLHFDTPNPHLRIEGSPFRINGRRSDWTGVADGDGRHVRCAGVSSFGFGGTNAHVVLEEYRPQAEGQPRRGDGPWLVPLSAPDGEALEAYASRLARVLQDDPDIDVAAVAYTLQVGRQAFPHRLAVVAADRGELLAALADVAGTSDPERGLYRGVVGEMAVSAGDESDPARLAKLWVEGGEVDWHRLWSQKPRRVSLPTFALAKTRHWFDGAPARGPAVGTTALSALSVSSSADAAPAPRARARRTKRRLEPTSVPEQGRIAPTQIEGAADARRQSLSSESVAGLIKARLSAILGIPSAEISEDRPFFDFGLDSIYGMELVRLLNASFHLELKASELYDYDTIAKLATFVTAQPGAEALPAREERPPRAEAPPADGTLVDLEGLCGEVLSGIVGRTIDRRRSFAENGLTSFDMLRAVNALERRFGSLRKALLFEHPTLSALAAYLHASHGADAVTELKALSEPPEIRETAAEPREPAGAGSLIIRKSELARDPQVAALVGDLQARHEKESGLASRDIAPFIFLGSSRQGYFNFAQRQQDLLAFSYVGDEDYLPRLTAEWMAYARHAGLKPNLLSAIPLDTVVGTPFTATPFGVVQRLDNLDGFSLDGKDMRRLRYMVRRFERSGSCRTVEYQCGADPAVDRQMAALVDAWCDTKKMTNPYVAVVREELLQGRLAAKHRAFLTYCDQTLANAVIVTRLPSENGHLLDLEFYPADMPLGGLEYAIVNIIEKLRAEGSTIFSLGASFGVKVCDSPNPDAPAERALDELRAFGLFDGSGNFQFKNKFRPVNIPLFLCRPAAPDATDVSDIILMVANPVVPAIVPLPARSRPANDVRPVEATRAQPDLARTEAQREQQLKTHGFNVLRIPSRAIEFDLVTDSWAELDKPFVRARMSELHARQTVADAGPDLGAQAAMPFDCVVPTMSGRAAEALLCRAWPRRDGIILHNSLFPSWGASLAASGFTPALLSRAADARADDDTPFKGDLDVAALDRMLTRNAGSVRFVGIEVSNNAIGGYPISLANLRQVRELTASHRVPLVFDATRIVENACFIADREDGCGGREPWDIAQEILSLADSATLSVSKDFGIDFGGVVASRDPQLAANLLEAIEQQGPLANLASRGMIAHVLEDRDDVTARVRRRMDCVKLLWQALADAGAPVVGPVSGHCVLLNVARLAPFAGFDHPRQACLAWMFRRTGIRAAPHLAGLGNDPGAGDHVRLAVPLGLERADMTEIAARLAAMLREPGRPSDLVAVGNRPGSEAAITYHPVDRLPRDVALGLRTGATSANDNERLLREHCPDVERRLVRLAEGDVELFSAGQGPTLLLMHGFNIGAGVFARQFKAMADRYRLMVIHHPGVGATTAARDLSLEGLGRLFMEVLRRQDVAGPIHVLGTSFGGLTAQNFALQHPDYVSSLTLVSSSYKAGNRAGQVNQLATVVEQDFDRLIGNTRSERLQRERGGLEALLLRCESMDPQIGLRYLDEFAANPDFLSRLADIKKPTLIVQGRYDSVINEETAYRLRCAIAEAEYAEIPDAGHFPYLTSTDAFNQLLLDFLARHDSPRRSAEVHDFDRLSKELKKPR